MTAAVEERNHQRTGGPTTARRDPALDLLRSVALARIVLWHLFARTWLTWFASIPLMFFVAGTLLERPGPHLAFLARRLRRLLLPVWVYGLGVGAAGLWFADAHLTRRAVLRSLTWVLPLVDPVSTGWDGGWLSNHLWYLRTYLWILLLTPLLVRAARRVRWAATGAALTVIGLELAAHHHVPTVGSGSVRVLVGDTIVYGFFALLGIRYARRGPGFDLRLRPRTLALMSVLFACAAGLYVAWQGLPSEGVNGSYPAIALVGCAWIAAVGAMEQPIRRLAARPRVKGVTAAISSRSLTVYLWHPACIVIARRLVHVPGPAGSVLLVAVTSLLVLLAVWWLGWVESVAANRRGAGFDVRLRPATRNAAALVVSASLLVVAMPSLERTKGVVAATGTVARTIVVGIPAPSARAALGDEAFAPATTVAPPVTTAVNSGTAPLAVASAPVTTALSMTSEAALTGWLLSASATGPGAGSVAAPAIDSGVATPLVHSYAVALHQATATGGALKASTKKVSTLKVSTLKVGTLKVGTVAAKATAVTVPATTLAGASSAVVQAPTPAVAPVAAAPASPVTAPTTVPPAISVPALSSVLLQRALDTWRVKADPKITSMVVALRSGDQTWVSKSPENAVNPKYDPTGQFLAASITKTFTAALVLQQVERGTLQLDDPVPALNGLEGSVPAGITVRRLLTHTAGLVDYTAAPGYRADQPITALQAVKLSLAAPLQSGLGSTVRYANSGYLYLGLLLEQVTGHSYADLVAGLARDAGLKSTTLDTSSHLGWIGFSSGGIVSTASDLAVWGQALFTPGKILSAQMVSQMTTLGDMNLGLGVWPACPCSTAPDGTKRYTAIGHNTADGGMFFFPATGMTIVVMFEPEQNDIVSLMDALWDGLQ